MQIHEAIANWILGGTQVARILLLSVSTGERPLEMSSQCNSQENYTEKTFPEIHDETRRSGRLPHISVEVYC